MEKIASTKCFASFLIFLALIPTGSLASSIFPADFPKSLKGPASCMLRAIANTPGVDGGKLGVTKRAMFVHPTIEFRGRVRHGYRPIIQFFGTAPSDGQSEYYFQAVFGGLFGPPDKGPPTYGAMEVIDKWNAKCGVRANILFV